MIEADAAGEEPDGGLERAAQLDVPRDTKGDLDVGVLLSFPNARAGLTVKHLSEPDFGEGDERFELREGFCRLPELGRVGLHFCRADAGHQLFVAGFDGRESVEHSM